MTQAPEGPAFSVVIPTVGRLEQLDGCLNSLARLDFDRDRFEVVLADDEGRGGVAEIGRSHQAGLPLTIISTGGGAGAAAARNAGAAAANGRYVAFTDDDCRPEAGWLRELEAVLDENPGAAAGGCMVNGASGRWAAASQAVLDAAYGHHNDGPEGPRFFASSNLAFPADAFHEVGGFDESFLYAEDRELCERWLHSGRRFAYAPRAVVRHMRELTPRGLWRQHFGYGRGAWHYHRLRDEQEWGSFRIESGFYSELARQVNAPREGAGRATIAAGAVLTQAAAATGFFREALAARLARPTDPSR